MITALDYKMRIQIISICLDHTQLLGCKHHYLVFNPIILFEYGYHRDDEILQAYEEEIEGVNVKACENTKDMIKFLGMKDPGYKRNNSLEPRTSHTP